MTPVPLRHQTCRMGLRPGGFTLIEMVAALAIFAVLAAVSIAPLKLERQRAKERELRSALSQIREALDRYKRMTEDGLIEKAGPGASGYPSSLQVLRKGSATLPSPAAAASICCAVFRGTRCIRMQPCQQPGPGGFAVMPARPTVRRPVPTSLMSIRLPKALA